MSHSLVIFTDDILHICKSHTVFSHDKKVTAPYSGGRFECFVLSTGTLVEMKNRHISLKGRVRWNNCSTFIEKSGKCRRVLDFSPAKKSKNIENNVVIEEDNIIVHAGNSGTPKCLHFEPVLEEPSQSASLMDADQNLLLKNIQKQNKADSLILQDSGNTNSDQILQESGEDINVIETPFRDSDSSDSELEDLASKLKKLKNKYKSVNRNKLKISTADAILHDESKNENYESANEDFENIKNTSEICSTTCTQDVESQQIMINQVSSTSTTTTNSISLSKDSEVKNVTTGVSPKGTSKVVQAEGVSNNYRVVGHVLIQNNDVHCTVLETVHRGFYAFPLQQYETHIVTTLTTDRKTCPETTCELATKSSYPCVITKTKDQLRFAVSCCIPRGVLRGVDSPQPGTDISVIALNLSDLAQTTVSCVRDRDGSQFVTKNRKHHCLYCNKYITSFSHHILRVHKIEPEVIRISKMVAGSTERNNAIQLLRLAGDKEHNLKCKPENRLLVRKSKCPAKSVCCGNCGGMFGIKNFSRHDRSCRKRDSNRSKAVKQSRILFRINCQQKNPIESKGDSEVYKIADKLLDYMRDDNITEIVRQDEVIYRYACELAQKYSDDLSEAKNARQNLRVAAKLLKVIQENNPSISDFSKVLSVQNYDIIISAIREICKLNNKPSLRKPAVALQYSRLLKELAQILELAYMKKGRHIHENDLKTITDFLKYHKKRYVSLISKSAYKLMVERRVYENKNELPSCEDTAIYGSYIKEKAQEAYSQLVENGYNYQSWRLLGETVMLQLMFLNRRRVGEISKVLLTAYNNRTQLSDEDRQYLDPAQCILADNLRVMKIIGKRSRILPILMTLSNIEHLDLFINLRPKASVREDNKFLFALPHTVGHFDACSVIRDVSKNCGAKKPETLRGTLLRKQVATLTQLIAMDDNDIQQIADFMGHDLNIHKAVYRTPSAFLQITRLSKVFMAMSSGDLLKFKGKSIDEIEHNLADKILEIEDKDKQVTSIDSCDWDNEEENALPKLMSEQGLSGSRYPNTLRKTPLKSHKTIQQCLYETKFPKSSRRLRSHKNKSTPVKSSKVGGEKTVSFSTMDIKGTPEYSKINKGSPGSSNTDIEETPASSIMSTEGTPASFKGTSTTSEETPESCKGQKSLRKRTNRRNRLTPSSSKVTITELLHETRYPKRRRKLMWTPEEKLIIKNEFKECFNYREVFPTAIQCANVAKKFHIELRERNAQSINVWIREEKRRIFKKREADIF